MGNITLTIKNGKVIVTTEGPGFLDSSSAIFEERRIGNALVEALDWLFATAFNSCSECLVKIDKDSEHARGGSGLCPDCSLNLF